MRVLHVLNTNRFSGAENVACQIISMERQNGIDAIYCSLEGPIRNSVTQRNIPFIAVSQLSIGALKKIIDEMKPDVVHAHDMRASFVSAFTSKKIKVISHIHNNAFESRRISLKSLAFLVASRFIYHIFWVSDSAKNGYVFKKLVSNKSSVLHNIVNVEDVRKKAEQDSTEYNYDIVFLGRLTDIKNPERALQIFKSVHKSLPSSSIAFVGDGDLKDNLVVSINEMNLNESAVVLGFKDNPLKILKSAKAMLMTSKYEGLPMSVLEALALGVPVVSTPTDGVKEIISNYENGFISLDNDDLVNFLVNLLSKTDKTDYYLNCVSFSKSFNDMNLYFSEIIKEY